jgi:hypothetical protein
MERFVLDAAHSMWNKEGRFVWTTVDEDHVASEDDEVDDTLLNDDYSRIDVDKWAFHLSEYYSTGRNFRSQPGDQFTPDFHSPTCSSYDRSFWTSSINNLLTLDLSMQPGSDGPALPLRVLGPLKI